MALVYNNEIQEIERHLGSLEPDWGTGDLTVLTVTPCMSLLLLLLDFEGVCDCVKQR